MIKLKPGFSVPLKLYYGRMLITGMEAKLLDNTEVGYYGTAQRSKMVIVRYDHIMKVIINDRESPYNYIRVSFMANGTACICRNNVTYLYGLQFKVGVRIPEIPHLRDEIMACYNCIGVDLSDDQIEYYSNKVFAIVNIMIRSYRS